MGTQNSRGVVLLAILAKRLEILAVHTVFEPGLVNKDNHVGVFVPITIITAYDYFFNYTFKNTSVKSVQNLVLFKGLPKRGNTLAHCRFGFGCILQAFTLFLQLLNLAGQVQILSVVGLLVDGIFKTHINQLVFLDFQSVNISFGFRKTLARVAFRKSFFCPFHKLVQNILVILAQEAIRFYKSPLNRSFVNALALRAELFSFFGGNNTLPDSFIIL